LAFFQDYFCDSGDQELDLKKKKIGSQLSGWRTALHKGRERMISQQMLWWWVRWRADCLLKKELGCLHCTEAFIPTGKVKKIQLISCWLQVMRHLASLRWFSTAGAQPVQGDSDSC